MHLMACLAELKYIVTMLAVDHLAFSNLWLNFWVCFIHEAIFYRLNFGRVNFVFQIHGLFATVDIIIGRIIRKINTAPCI